MRNRCWPTAFMVAVCAAALGACSSSRDNGDGSPDAGSSGSAATGGSAAGNSSAGGGNSSTGEPDASGDDGSAASAEECPVQEPVEETSCGTVDLQCNYEGRDCTCEEGESADGLSPGWNCRRAAQMCPAEEPANGSVCTPGRGGCMFGSRICECPQDTEAWACWDPADCPTVFPEERAACDLVGMECEILQADGGDDECECTDQGWDCGRQFCPAAMPAPGDPCDGGDGACDFGSQTCDCSQDMWLCWDPADCPATPAPDGECTLEGMLCGYDGGECECEDLVWDCDDELLAGGDEDGGV